MLSPTFNCLSHLELQNKKQCNPLQIKNKIESPDYCSTEKEISVDDNGSLDLMIRAHQRIRTLEEDNQILRLHIELLSKDNKQLVGKLENVQHEKNLHLKSNQELLKRVRELEIKLDSYKVKEQLFRIEQQNINRKYSANYHKSPQITVNCLNPQINNLDTSQLSPIFQKISNIKCLPDKSYVLNEKNLNENVLNKYSTFQIKNNQCENLPKPQSKQKQQQAETFKIQSPCTIKKNHSSHTLYSSQKMQNMDFYQPQLNVRPSRNFSCKSGSKQENKTTGFQLCNNFYEPQSPKSVHNLSKYNCQSKLKSETCDGFYLTKNIQARTSSPLIRRNSPLKSKNGECQFHPHSRNINTSSIPVSTENSLTKKFNYTNWRKTNSNLMVWRVASGLTNHKSITLNR